VSSELHDPRRPRTAFVLGGGGLLGAAEVGMLRALLEAGVVPDLVIGTSIGAANGALIADDPTEAGLARLEALWSDADEGPFSGSWLERAQTVTRTALRTRTALYGPEALHELVERHLTVELIEDLTVPFMCCAASVERAAEHWFTSGPIVPAVLASSAVPGLFPAYEIDGEHFIDGGIVNSIPLDRARKSGAERVFVLQVGRIEQPLAPATNPLEVGLVAFEVARRARFTAALARAQTELEVHVLPTGGTAPRYNERATLGYRDTSKIPQRIALARNASAAYLADHGITG
jgi:NTE family protein